MTLQELRVHEERIQELIYDQIDRHGYDAIRRAICRKRKKMGIRQAEVCATSGIDAMSMARWEAGQTAIERLRACEDLESFVSGSEDALGSGRFSHD